MTTNPTNDHGPFHWEMGADLPRVAPPCSSASNQAPGEVVAVDVVEKAWASSHGLKASLESSGLFNLDDPDLFSCLPTDNIIKRNADQLLTVDLELFPELLGLDKVTDSKPTVGTLDLGSVSELTSDEDVSPAETEASLDHFFNTFTDLTEFLENLSEETGPENHADDKSAVLAGNTDTTNETTTAPLVGNLCTNPIDADDEPNEPLAKRACKSDTTSTRTRQTYRQRRNKNNVASRVSRATRKNKVCSMETRAIELEIENEHLTKKIEELTEIAELSRKHLIEALSNK